MAARFKKKFLAAYGAEKQQHQAQSDPSLQQSHAGDNTTQVGSCSVRLQVTCVLTPCMIIYKHNTVLIMFRQSCVQASFSEVPVFALPHAGYKP